MGCHFLLQGIFPTQRSTRTSCASGVSSEIFEEAMLCNRGTHHKRSTAPREQPLFATTMKLLVASVCPRGPAWLDPGTLLISWLPFLHPSPPPTCLFSRFHSCEFLSNHYGWPDSSFQTWPHPSQVSDHPGDWLWLGQVLTADQSACHQLEGSEPTWLPG